MSKVSVIMPAYNAELYIEEAINSVLSQTYADWELIIIDDASLDKTVEIVNKIVAIDKRIVLYKNAENSGVSFTRNRGIDMATGEYIAFLDSDDIWKAHKLEKQLRELERTKADLSYTSYYLTGEKGQKRYKVSKSIDFEGLLKENIIGCSTVVVKADVMRKYRFDSSFFHEDYVLWLTLFRSGCTAVGIEEEMVYYRDGGRSANKFAASKNRWLVYRQHEKLPLLKSSRYMLCYILGGLKKYFSRVEQEWK